MSVGVAESFDAGSLERRYAILAELPEPLFAVTVTHPVGPLLQRVQAVLQWRSSLLRGELPEAGALTWPTPSMAAAIHRELSGLGIARYCRNEPELTDAVTSHLLEITREAVLRRSNWVREQLDRLRREEIARRREVAAKSTTSFLVGGSTDGSPAPAAGRAGRSGNRSSKAKGSGEATGTGAEEGEPREMVDAETLAALQKKAEALADIGIAQFAAARVKEQWDERVAVWRRLEEVFGELSAFLGAGWTLTQGILRSRGWTELTRLRQLLEHVPALKRLIQTLGRMQSGAQGAASSFEQVVGPMRRVVIEREPVKSPLVPTETRGIVRSDDLARMLPSEAVLLTHPTLRLLWHARRAERGLMTYRLEGDDFRQVEKEHEAREARRAVQNKLERGPIIACVDTSGSMSGMPELVAKALVLEALRVAWTEKRGCYVYTFGGPGEVVEHELERGPRGIERLLAFLTLSFGGGTDITAPLSRAIRRLEQPEWSGADVLLVSDGEFSVPSFLSDSVKKAREVRGVRVHSVQIGDSGGAAMASVSDHVHRFSSWQVLGNGASDVRL